MTATYREQGDIAVITLNNPPVNGLGYETRKGIVDGIHRAIENHAVKAIVREIVDAEDRRAPLSDSAIARELKARGITLARRTVVKYRDQLGIPAARLRRQHGG